MPRYFFNLHDDEISNDEEGKMLPDLRAAHQYGLKEARAMVCESIREGHLNLGHRIEIVNDRGIVALSITFKDAFTVEG